LSCNLGDNISEQFEERAGRGCAKKLKSLWMLRLFQMVLLRRIPSLCAVILNLCVAVIAIGELIYGATS
jgi:hypothetical protein